MMVRSVVFSYFDAPNKWFLVCFNLRYGKRDLRQVKGSISESGTKFSHYSPLNLMQCFLEKFAKNTSVLGIDKAGAVAVSETHVEQANSRWANYSFQIQHERQSGFI